MKKNGFDMKRFFVPLIMFVSFNCYGFMSVTGSKEMTERCRNSIAIEHIRAMIFIQGDFNRTKRRQMNEQIEIILPRLQERCGYKTKRKQR